MNIETGTLGDAMVTSGAALAAAAALHWGLDRLAKRLPRWRARRFHGDSDIPRLERSEHLLALLLAPVKLALWLATVLYVANQFPAFRAWRAMFIEMTGDTLTIPLFDIEGRTFSTVDVVELPLILLCVWAVVSIFTLALRKQVLAYTGMNRGLQETVALLTRYALTLIVGIIVLQTWGFDLRALALAFSVLGVGIGFGLQNIANNFVSGLVINFERPIQPGDFVKVGGLSGTVERIGGRSTLIRTLDAVSILVPNSRLLESEVVNWTHGDPVSRLHVPIGVAYDSNLRLVRATLLELARNHPDVLKDPKPRVELRDFGNSSLDLELLVWTRDPRSQARLISDLNFRIVAAFRRNAIEIPFTQHDLNLRTPEIGQLVGAWSRRTFTTEELAEPVDKPPRHSEVDYAFADDRGPESWSDERIDGVVARMRGTNGVTIVDRRHFLKTYRRCFVGREAIEWLMRNEDLPRSEAVAFGEILVRRGVLHHVLDEHGFNDGAFFYRFRDDEIGSTTA